MALSESEDVAPEHLAHVRLFPAILAARFRT